MRRARSIDAARKESKPVRCRPERTGLPRRAVSVLPWIAAFLVTLPTNLSAQAVCDRTPEVRDELLKNIGISSCEAVTWDQLAKVTSLNLNDAGITTLQSFDFVGLDNLEYLSLNDNSLSDLPTLAFRGLGKLEDLRIGNNSLSTLPQGIFHRLHSLRRLHLNSNSLTALPEHIFTGLSNLKTLWLAYNSLSTMPGRVFAGLSSLEELWLSDNSLSNLTPEYFRGLSSLKNLSLAHNSLSTLPGQVFVGLSSLEMLSLTHNSLSTLPAEVFRGLSSLRQLWMGANPLSTLPAGVFRGLSSLRELWMESNTLKALPDEVFHGLNNLEVLSLGRTSLKTLPSGIFDDVLDTLGSHPHETVGLQVRHRLKASVAFASSLQAVVEGNTVRAGVILDRSLPVAVRVPYSLSGTATPDDYTNLSPPPDSGLLFLAGENSKDITFTLLEDEDSREETILLTLGELSSIGLRRSDGSGPDAPHLKAETLVYRRADRAEYTVTVAGGDPVSGPQGVCDRTPQVRQELVELARVSTCGEVTPEHLAGVTWLDVSDSGLGFLQEHDFSGMRSLEGLSLNDNSLSDLPEGVFNGLGALQTLQLSENALTVLPDGVFSELGAMQSLYLGNNRLSVLNEGTFSGMTSLRELSLERNLLTALPEGLFRGLSKLVRLELQGNALVALPERIFNGLRSLESLRLYGNHLSALPKDIFDGLSNLERLDLGDNSIFTVPAEIFRGLSSLQELNIWRNPLQVLPADIFHGLGNLESLLLGDNHLQALPEGIFDDVLDTLGRTPGSTGLSMDYGLMAILAFASTAQDGIQGTTVTAAVDLNRRLPLAVRVPYSVGGTATPDDYTNLSPAPDSGLLFLAGETRKEIVLTLQETEDSREKTVVLTLGDLSEVRLRRSDGTGPDAPHLRAETVLYRRPVAVTHTVTVPGADPVFSMEGVCGRTPQVRDKLVEASGVSTCEEVTAEHMAGVTVLELSDSGIGMLQEHDFSGLSGLRTLRLNNNSLTNLPEGVFGGLASLELLWLHGNLLSTLPEGLFSGLSSLGTLHLYNNSLSALPEGIFRGLDSLSTLHLYNNTLSALPEGIFTGLSSLERLELWGNRLSELPIGVFDDVLDTLGTDPGSEEFFVDPDLKPSLAFTEAAQKGLKGTTVRAGVTLSRHLPVAVRVPYSVGGSATANDYMDLSPAPASGLLFLAGETRKEITFTLLENQLSSRETVVLTLGELSGIGLRPSDGTGSDAPNLQAASLLGRPAYGAVHTVTVSGRDPVSELDGVCGRTPQVRDKLMEVTGVSACEDADRKRLAEVTRLDLPGSDIGALQEKDFSGLSSLESLNLHNNHLSSLPRGIFSGLTSLQRLYLDRNRLDTLPEGVFSELGSLTILWLNSNSLTTLPQGIFGGLTSLEWLRLSRNSLTTLPEGVFRGLTSLESLALTLNSLTALPRGLFSGLNRLKELRLAANSLAWLPLEIFSGLSSLEWLGLGSNSLSDLPEGVFSELHALKVLRLGSNSLETLSPEAFHGLTGLEWLDLSFNSLTGLPEGIFGRFSNLRQLDLPFNSLSALPGGIFNGLHALEVLRLNSNSLDALPRDVFQGLRNLRILEIQRCSLTVLPEAIFSDLSSLEILWLTGNSLSVLPEKSFQGLTHLQRLWLDENSLTSLPQEIFKGMNSVKELKLAHNNLNALPNGVFDDMLGTLGQTIEPLEVAYTLFLPFQGGLYLDDHLKAGLGFASTAQRVAPGSAVTVPVALSRALPVAVRVPYTVGVTGNAGGSTVLSPAPEEGLLFPAGETRREISLTLPEDGGDQEGKTLVFALGKPSRIGLRRSDGSAPDAPHLKFEHLLDLPVEGTIHTVNVSGVDPAGQDPFCLSLWEGSSCAAVATLSPVLVGTQGNNLSKTEVVITNRDPQPTDCQTALLFHQGTTPAPEVLFDGQAIDRNLLYTTIPEGGAEILTLTAPDVGELSAGAAYVFTRSPCTASSLHVRANYLIEDTATGEIDELFSVTGQSVDDWLQDGDCRLLTGVFGRGRNLEFAAVTARPESAAPPGALLRFQTYDLDGNSLGRLPGLEISGKQQIHSFPEFKQPRIIQTCLDVPGTGTFGLALTPIGTGSSGIRVQYATERFPADPERDEANRDP